MSPKYIAVAHHLERLIADGTYPAGARLPHETKLAEDCAVARGTVRRALEYLSRDRGLVALHGRVWVVRPPVMDFDYQQLRSFREWALAFGAVPASTTIERRRGRANAFEAEQLGQRHGSPVLRLKRVYTVDAVPALFKRVTYAEWLIPLVEQLPNDAQSIMDEVSRRFGVRAGHGVHRVSGVQPALEDARHLGVEHDTNLLQLIRTLRTTAGVPFEVSQDLYRSDLVAFRFENTAAGRPSHAGAPPGGVAGAGVSGVPER